MSLLLFDAFDADELAITGTASAQVSAITVDVVAPPDPVDIAITGVASAQVTSIRSGYPHHIAQSTRTFVWRI